MARKTLTARLHVPVRPAMKARLDKLARDTDLPVAHHTRQALAEYLERHNFAVSRRDPAA